MIHENSLQLNQSLINISNTSTHFRDVSDVRAALQNQIQVHNELQNFSQQVNELITRGNELMREPLVPKYVQQDIQNIQKIFNEKISISTRFISKT